MDIRVLAHFQKYDPILFAVIERFGDAIHHLGPTTKTDYFSDLCETIVNQQLSEKAGATIWKRFRALYTTFNPQAVLSMSEDAMRSAGISRSKVSYIKHIAQYAMDNDWKKFHAMSDDAVIEELTTIKGIGRWSAEMFLMFSLGRPDVFSEGDVGLQRAIQNIYGKRSMRKIIASWSPYKTYACRILWKSLSL